VPASRFWMLSLLLALLAAGGGYWILARDMGSWLFNDLYGMIRQSMSDGDLRRGAHVITGGSLIILPLFLAMLARWSPRQKWLLAIFAVLILFAIGAQIWLGSLLLLDTPQGPLMKFN